MSPKGVPSIVLAIKFLNPKPFAVAKYSSQLLQHVIEENKLTRVQASVHVDDKQAVRYVEWLGFENEGLMKKFGPDGSDYYRFARVM